MHIKAAITARITPSRINRIKPGIFLMRRLRVLIARFTVGFCRVSVTVHSPRPQAGEGLEVRGVDSTTGPLTLTFSPLAGGEETE